LSITISVKQGLVDKSTETQDELVVSIIDLFYANQACV